MINSKEPKENENIIIQGDINSYKELKFIDTLSTWELRKLNSCCFCYTNTIERSIIISKIMSYFSIIFIVFSILAFFLFPEYKDNKKIIQNIDGSNLYESNYFKYWYYGVKAQLGVYIIIFIFLVILLIFISINKEKKIKL